MVEDGKRAYNALLTLLNDNSKVTKKAKISESAAKPSREKQVEAVEGFESGEQEKDNIESDQNYKTDKFHDDEEIQIDDDNEGDSQDPFESHFAAPQSFTVPDKWTSRLVSSLPLLGNRSLLSMSSTFNGDKEVDLNPSSAHSAFAKIKHRLQAPFSRYNGDLTTLQTELAAPLLNYLDIFLNNRTWSNYDQMLNFIILHLTNHIYKTRDRILKNNSRIKENQNVELDLRDQGFTRPKVLVLLPTRNAAYDFYCRLVKISGLSQSENQKRFKDAFFQQTVDISNKPDDFQHTFSGNTNEVFCLGVKFTRQALKLYSSFYASDLIIAGPLGLRLIVDKKDYDFLSSIEICVCDQLDVAAQQSWANLKQVFDKLNLIPKNSHDCDFSRIREWYLDDKAKYLRQTILISGYSTPEMVALYNKQCSNVFGKFRSRAEVTGVLSGLNVHIRQVFTRIGVQSFTQDSKQRLSHFTASVLPNLMRGSQTDGFLVVAPTYTDFVVLRNYLEKNDYSYVSLSEYTSPSQLGRGRTFFANGKAKIMLYSTRLHHYRRYSIKGARHVVFYGLPDNPLFYSEFVKFLARTVIEQQVDPDLLKVSVLFTKWDALKLERIVGTQRMSTFIEGLSDTHEFY